MESYDLTIVIKSYDDRTFTGYVSVEVIDHDGDVVPIKVLDKSFKPYLRRGGVLLLVHKGLPVGVLTKHFVTTHPKSGKPAIAVHGRIHNDGSSLFDAVWKQFVDPSTPVGFSIGAKPLSWRVELKGKKPVRIFQEIELYEVSVVCEFQNRKHEPANQFANLIGLGHLEVVAPIPSIASKVIIKMADPKKEEIEKTQTEETPEEEAVETSTIKETIVDDIRKDIEKEAEQMLGGSTAINLLQEEQGKNAELLKSNQDLQREVETYKLALTQEKVKIEELTIDLTKAEAKAEVWRDMFKKNATNEDALKSLLSANRVVSNTGGVPPNQGVQPSQIATKTRDGMDKIEEYLNGKMGTLTDEKFLKIRALARNGGGY